MLTERELQRDWKTMRFTTFPILLLRLRCFVPVLSANWAQLAGEREQNTATPYIPDQWHRDKTTSIRPMWSARWGHAAVVLNQSIPRRYLTDEENSARAKGSHPVVVLLGGDDGLPRDTNNLTTKSAWGIGSGKLRNDVWVGKLASASQSSWQVDDRFFADGGMFTPNLIQSKMRWIEVNPGRIAPATWQSGRKYGSPLTNEEWIACQEKIKHKLIDPSICNEPPRFCYDDIRIPGCTAQAVWKRDNMWSPRRGFGAQVVNNKIYVIGGRAREYARIDDSRLVGDIAGRGRVETMRDHSTIRENLLVKNDIWSSEDDGRTWKLVSPGCRDHQQDILMKTEVWSRNVSDPSFHKHVGSIGSKCYLSSDCYGVADCKALGNTKEKVCVCPMFSPREHHTFSVQHRFSIQDDGSVFEEDVMYVVGGFTYAKQSFCSDRACGPADGYKVALDDVWMSSNGVDWVQIKSAFDTQTDFVARGSHTALIVPMSYSNTSVDMRDRLLIFGGETAHPRELSTTFLNDIWELALPTEPCCSNTRCPSEDPCLPSISDLKVVTLNADWTKRSGHTTVYEPPSSSNLFQPRIYLSGGKNNDTIFSDVWSWHFGLDENWSCDFGSTQLRDASVDADRSGFSSYDFYLSIDSPLSKLRRFTLPPLDVDGKLNNFSFHSASPITNSMDLSIMAAAHVNTISDLVSADLYTILKLRGFDYPGMAVDEVTDICLLREISLAFVEKCTLKEFPRSFPHSQSTKLQKRPSDGVKSSFLCGRGGDSKPCTKVNWDGCTPMEDVSVVDVLGLGMVKVPEFHHNVSGIIDELFCQQVPGGRTFGTAVFMASKVLVLGGINGNMKRLYRDVWARDDMPPHAGIKTKPGSQSPQFTFSFDSNEDGAHVFEYKIFHDEVDVTSWTTTTKSIGADVSWLERGPGRGWYTLYVRAVDPAGNRDNVFSTHTNVFRWYYVPPIPWGALAGGIITSLLVIIVCYFEYRRRKRKATLERFALRRLRRKFKLRDRTADIGRKPMNMDHLSTTKWQSIEFVGQQQSLENDDLLKLHTSIAKATQKKA
eukprot:CCRYP_014936-RB/>CCRYP_014936-RB protein AED:0.02 eAED:0.02 QI:12561/0.87/0.77/1/0.25/0/9/0/1053